MKAAQGKIEAAQSDYRQALEVAPPGQLRDDLLTKINGFKSPCVWRS